VLGTFAYGAEQVRGLAIDQGVVSQNPARVETIDFPPQESHTRSA
jgi:hypothetical protein